MSSAGEPVQIVAVACFTKSNGKHRDAHNGIGENCKGESKRQHADTPLFESAGGVGEKEDCREQDGVGEILAGNITELARFGYFRSGLSIRLRGLARAPNFIEVRDEWMRVSIWILKRLLRQPGIVRFPQRRAESAARKSPPVFRYPPAAPRAIA